MPRDRTARRGVAARPSRSARSCRARPSPPVNVAIAQRKWAPVSSPEPKARDRWLNFAGRPLCPILPIHGEFVAALDAFHVFGLSRYVLSLVTAGAHEMRLMHHAPGLRSILPDFYVVRGNAHFDLVHVHHDPGLAGLFDDAVPRAAPQPFLLGALAAAPTPSHIGHALTPVPRASLPARARGLPPAGRPDTWFPRDRKSTRLNSSHGYISYAVFCLKK